MTLFNYWHYIVFAILLLTLAAGIIASIKQPVKKLVAPMIISVSLIVVLIAGFSVVVVDKYTKKASLHRFENKRILNIEKIVYRGVVRNDGFHTIGEVTLEIKIVNKARDIGPSGSMFTPSGFADFFGGGANILYKPQNIKKEFVVATNLKPGQAKAFRVYFDYPPYFRNVSQFAKLISH